MINEMDPYANGAIDFYEFVLLMARKIKKYTDTEKEMIEALKVFDRGGTGLISCADLRYMIRQLGEHLTDEEVNEIIREAVLDDDGQINYQKFVRMLMDS
jgi:calmodulin